MIETWHISISGFRQDIASPTGLEQVWQELRNLATDKISVTTPQVWDADWSAFAEFIFRNSVDAPTIKVYAYSWGAGFGLLKFADALDKCGLGIDACVLADPVYRSNFVTLAFLSLTKLPKIVIPANIRRVSWFRQTRYLPRGHDLVAADPALTTISDAVVLATDHAHIDNSWQFKAECWRVATNHGQPAARTDARSPAEIKDRF